MAVQVSAHRRAAIVTIGRPGNGEDATSSRALRVLREDVLPTRLRSVPGVRADATGLTTITVTAAATVMVFVVLTFVSLSQVSVKELGAGLAVAVRLDATLVRGLLLPSATALLGDADWYLPRWLHWLPQVSHGAELPSARAVPGQVVSVPAPRSEQEPAGRPTQV